MRSNSTPWNLIEACEPADVVILAIPFDQVRGTLEAIGPFLRPGCVVLDTSPFKQPAIEWAAKHLPEGTYLVGIALGINPETMLDQTGGPAGARADLFANSPCCVVPSPTCRPEAVKTAQDVATLLGATPYFLDPAEYDGVSTVVNLMPALMASGLMGPTIESPGWREMRRLSSSDLLQFSAPLAAGGPAVAQAAILNQATVLHWLDEAMARLQAIRRQVESGAEEDLAAQIGAVYDGREEWLADWQLNRWERQTAAEMPSAGSWFGQLFGFRSRRKPEDNE